MIRRNPQTFAWLILITGLLLFCLFFSGAGYGLYYFLYQSPVPLIARLVVSRGNVKAQTLDGLSPLIDTTYTVDIGTSLEIRDDSQAILTFQDGFTRTTVATITLTAGTRLYLSEAARPRFEFSRRPYRITIERISGQFIILATPGDRDLSFDLRGDLGVARLLSGGRYTVSTEFYADTGLRRINLFNQGGRATLLKPSLDEWREVSPNRIAHIANGEFELESDSPYQILAEGRFISEQYVARDSLPENWVCQTIAEQNELPGEVFRDPDQNSVLRFVRVGENRIKHGETACLVRTGNADGLDTSDYGGLRLHMNLKLTQSSLTLCGIVGSECPIMIEVAYRLPGETAIRRWRHGFYLTPDSTKPPSCDTCRAAHERINPDVWYFYDSGELRPQLADLSPSSPIVGQTTAPIIKYVSVYASGHQWDVQISDITLLGVLR